MVPFDVDTINEFLGTQLVDDVECQFSMLDDEGVAPGELIQALCLAGEGFHRGTIQRGSLHPLARFWSAFVHANISPCSHVSDLTEGRATILYTILTGRVMDVGQFIANEIHRCANADGKAALGHPSLITHLCSQAGVDILCFWVMVGLALTLLCSHQPFTLAHILFQAFQLQTKHSHSSKTLFT